MTIISITSLVGVATIPFFGKAMCKKILATLVALAVGSLAGDSLLQGGQSINSQISEFL